MREYSIVPEYRYSRYFLFAAILYQIAAVGFVIYGCRLATGGFILAVCFQLCAIYYGWLFVHSRYYRLNMTPDLMTVEKCFHRSRSYQADTLRWKIRRIPWYDSYYIFLYSCGRMPAAILKPHWKNALGVLRLRHDGVLTETERKHLEYLKRVGMVEQDGKHFYSLR